jgi:hypothetical protein
MAGLYSSSELGGGAAGFGLSTAGASITPDLMIHCRASAVMRALS